MRSEKLSPRVCKQSSILEFLPASRHRHDAPTVQRRHREVEISSLPRSDPATLRGVRKAKARNQPNSAMCLDPRLLFPIHLPGLRKSRSL